jgi:hypothetical protein
MLRVSREEFAEVYRTSVRRMLAGIATPAYLAEIETEASHR